MNSAETKNLACHALVFKKEQFPLLKQAICRRPPRLRRQPYPAIELRHRIERPDLSKLVERDFGGSGFVNLWLSECIITYGGKEIRTATVDGNLLAPEELNVSLRAHPSQPDIQLILDSNPPLMKLRLGEYLKGTQVEPTSQFNLRDPQALRLVQALECDMDQDCPAGTVFAERIGGALSVYLAHRSERNSPNSGVVAGGVASRRFTRVLEYIRANLDHDIHIDELADAAGLSMFHFAKLFKRSTGSSPHQYILHGRLERATELLRNTQLCLSEIALRAGFADQSHLTNVFRRVNGVTPSRFRAQI